MEKKNLAEFLNWLQLKQNAVFEIEKQGKECVVNSDIENYKKLMYQKAEILADLTDDALPLLAKLSPPLSEDIKQELNSFSINASEALELNSVFYMSALLFPSNHKDGEPDNLQKFIDQIKMENKL